MPVAPHERYNDCPDDEVEPSEEQLEEAAIRRHHAEQRAVAVRAAQALVEAREDRVAFMVQQVRGCVLVGVGLACGCTVHATSSPASREPRSWRDARQCKREHRSSGWCDGQPLDEAGRALLYRPCGLERGHQGRCGVAL